MCLVKIIDAGFAGLRGVPSVNLSASELFSASAPVPAKINNAKNAIIAKKETRFIYFLLFYSPLSRSEVNTT